MDSNVIQAPAQFFGAVEPLHGLHIAVLVNILIKPTAFSLRAAKSKPNSQSQYRAKKLPTPAMRPYKITNVNIFNKKDR